MKRTHAQMAKVWYEQAVADYGADDPFTKDLERQMRRFEDLEARGNPTSEELYLAFGTSGLTSNDPMQPAADALHKQAMELAGKAQSRSKARTTPETNGKP